MGNRFLITGSMGCLGAWTVRTVLEDGGDVVAFDLSTDDRRLRLVLSEEELEEVRFVRGDIVDGDLVRQTVANERITHIVHLAALQVPFCKADPQAGARVNVVGTVNVFEAALAAKDRIEGLAYASSVAVLGPPELYRDVVDDDARPAPQSLYGVYKQANEGTARVYAEDHGLPSVGLRPYIVYGPGRDQGLTSGASTAMLAAAAGRPFRISHGGKAQFHYARDVARLFVRATRATPKGAEVLNVGGRSVSMDWVVAAIEAAAPDASGTITYEEVALPFPPHLDGSGLDALLGGVQYTPLEEGIAESIALFRKLLDAGRLETPAEGL